MNFANTSHFPIILLSILLLSGLFIWLNARYFKWIKTYWFFERTWIHRFSYGLYLASLSLLLLSLLDLRGPEQRMNSSLPDQKTIIILDTSLSMLAEDVKPSRFLKSLQLARHFAKKAPGHQIGIVLFSDNQKRLLPFTDDVDLIDSRLASLEKTNAISGGTNISQAITEAIQYFRNGANAEDKNLAGNILVFTDGEEGEADFKLDLPSNMALAVVGVGTANGGNIPLRWEDGSFRGYKTSKGEPVITKLDERYIKSLGREVKAFKYWIANSYSLPTDEIMDFFRSHYRQKNGVGQMHVRPVLSHLILIPAILLYCLSVILGRFPVFKH